MRVLNRAVSLDRFSARFAEAHERILLSDYGGTLAPFHVRPELARLPPLGASLRETAADLWLRPPRELVGFLARRQGRHA